MILPFDTLAIRALNSCRVRHLPTYVGMRALADATIRGPGKRWGEHVALQAASAQRSSRYYKFLIPKEVENDNVYYRDSLIGSPLTSIAEALVLAIMSTQPAFAVGDCVYSYLWPASPRSGRNFRYYFHDYSRRNDFISSHLARHPGDVAVVADIKKFYPSVDWARLSVRLSRRLGGVERKQHRIVEDFFAGLRGASPKGIPIGPDASHALGHVAMEEVDRGMQASLGRRYCRYVDDIIVLCPSSEAARWQSKLADLVAAEGLSLHEEKNDCVTAEAWLRNVPNKKGATDGESFEAIVDKLRFLLLLQPKKYDNLVRAFKDAGISLPLAKLRTEVRYGPLQRYHIAWARSRHRRAYVWRLLRCAESELVDSAKRARGELRRTLAGLRDATPARGGMRRRWFVQKSRYCLNRLLYLMDQSTYRELEELIPAGEEFAELRALLSALIQSDPIPVLRFPGPAVWTFCELATRQAPIVIGPKLPFQPSRAIGDSLASLALLTQCNVPNDLTAALQVGSRILVDVCMKNPVGETEIRDQSYLDELELLLRAEGRGELARFSTTRYDEREHPGLAALLLGTGGYAS